MIKPGTGFQVPDDMRAMLEQGVTQAREGFGKVMSAAEEAVAALEGKAGSAQARAAEIRRKSLTFTENSMAAAFELAQKMVNAKSIDEVMKLQADYMSKQMASVRSHVEEAGQAMQQQSKAVAEELAAEVAKIQGQAKDIIDKGVAAAKDAAKGAAKPKK